MIRSETINKVASAMVKARGQFPTIRKDRVNPHFKSRYADLATVIEAVTESLSVNGLVILQPTDETDTGTMVETLIVHGESGEYIGSTYKLKMAKDDAQGKGAGLTYARRFALCSLLGIAADDDDDGHQASQPQRREQAPPPRQQERPAAPAKDEFSVWLENAAKKLKITTADLVDRLAARIGTIAGSGPERWHAVRLAWLDGEERIDLIEECRRMAGNATQPQPA